MYHHIEFFCAFIFCIQSYLLNTKPSLEFTFKIVQVDKIILANYGRSFSRNICTCILIPGSALLLDDYKKLTLDDICFLLKEPFDIEEEKKAVKKMNDVRI